MSTYLFECRTMARPTALIQSSFSCSTNEVSCWVPCFELG